MNSLKTLTMKKFTLLLLSIITFSFFSLAQQFEEPKLNGEQFTKVKAHVGADFALQYQALEHSADSTLIPIGSGINLPTANLRLSADLAPGMQVHLHTYLSSRHHTEAWVKGGYLLIDEMPFLNSSFVDNIMQYLTIKAGMDEVNFGDAHFRRSDNGNVIHNPFVGNLIMDAFTTAPTIEIYFRNNGLIFMGAISGGSLKPALTGYSAATQSYTAYDMKEELAFYWKAGFDKNLSEDFRLRITASGYHLAKQHFGSLYSGDRAGSRYYTIMNRVTNNANDVTPAVNHTSGRWGPGFTDKNNAFMFNLFTKFKGIELFGTYEMTKGNSAFGGAEFDFNQYAIEGLYRFGGDEQFFIGARYNQAANDADLKVDRMQAGAGWFMTKNTIVKLEYVDQNYTDFAIYGSNAGFNGIMFEAAISF